MRPTSGAFLARQVTAQITDAACRGLGAWWSQQEAAHARAETPAAAANAAAYAMSVCATCPVTGAKGLCALRAELDTYTGLAAGAAYVNGHAHPVSTVRRKPTPPLSQTLNN